MDERFVQRWADRFFEIVKKNGERAARAWLGTFVNKEDYTRVADAISNRRGHKQP